MPHLGLEAGQPPRGWIRCSPSLTAPEVLAPESAADPRQHAMAFAVPVNIDPDDAGTDAIDMGRLAIP